MKSAFRHLVAGLAVAIALAAPAGAQTRITGSGASFPFPLYAAWFQALRSEGLRIDYQSTGSGAGVQAFINRTVDFAASDSAMSDEQLAQVNGGALVLPMTAGTIVLAYNLPGVADLKLPRDVYPAIFTGEVTRWNDPKIVAANPGVTLPDQPITVVRRSDSSGTTFVFTKHLSAISDTFETKMGTGTTVQWPSLPTFVGAPRNDGVTATVMQTPGAIGYIEWGFAKLSNLPTALLQNKDGAYVLGDAAGGAAALASAELSGDDLRIWVQDPSGAESYPITTFTWMLFYQSHGRPQIAEGLRQMANWAMDSGQAMAEELGYVPLPPVVIEKVRTQIPLIQ